MAKVVRDRVEEGGAQGRGGVAKPVGNRVIKKAHQDGGGEAVEGVVVGGGGRAVDRRCEHGGPEVVMEGGMPDQAQGGDKLTRRTEEGGDDAKHCAKGIVELNERRGRRREARAEGVGVGEEGHDGGKGRSVQEGGSGGVAALGGEVEEATTVVHPVGEGRPIAEDARVEGVGQAGVHDGRKGGPGAKGEDERPGRLTDGQADALGFVGRTDHPGAVVALITMVRIADSRRVALGEGGADGAAASRARTAVAREDATWWSSEVVGFLAEKAWRPSTRWTTGARYAAKNHCQVARSMVLRSMRPAWARSAARTVCWRVGGGRSEWTVRSTSGGRAWTGGRAGGGAACTGWAGGASRADGAGWGAGGSRGGSGAGGTTGGGATRTGGSGWTSGANRADVAGGGARSL